MAMVNNTKKVVILTTKKYPIAKDWNPGKTMDISRLGMFTDKNGINGLVALLDFDNKTDLQDAFFKTPCVRTKRFNNDAWEIHVVPCMGQNDILKSEHKCQYIEYILELCSNGCDRQNVYLVAHDKDFVNFEGVKGGELLKEKHIPTQNCVRLKELVGIGHAYMFQHDDGNNVGKVILKINNGFDENDFKVLLDIIDAEWEMNDFFTMVNKDAANEYPYPKTTTIAP